MVVYLKSETNYEYFGEQVRLVRVSLEIRRSTGCNYRNSSAPVVKNISESDRANSTRKIRDKFSRCTRGSRSLHHSHELNRRYRGCGFADHECSSPVHVRQTKSHSAVSTSNFRPWQQAAPQISGKSTEHPGRWEPSAIIR